MNFDEKERCVLNYAVEIYGEQAQIDMAIEEMSELIKSLLKQRRAAFFGPYDKENRGQHIESISEETADVLITLEQIQMIFNNNSRVEEIKRQKVQRLDARLEHAVEEVERADLRAIRMFKRGDENVF